jgi:hypothetical protein
VGDGDGDSDDGSQDAVLCSGPDKTKAATPCDATLGAAWPRVRDGHEIESKISEHGHSHLYRIPADYTLA